MQQRTRPTCEWSREKSWFETDFCHRMLHSNLNRLETTMLTNSGLSDLLSFKQRSCQSFVPEPISERFSCRRKQRTSLNHAMKVFLESRGRPSVFEWNTAISKVDNFCGWGCPGTCPVVQAFLSGSSGSWYLYGTMRPIRKSNILTMNKNGVINMYLKMNSLRSNLSAITLFSFVYVLIFI